jgi:hypothetical protein
MTNFNIIGALRTFATSRGWRFGAGNNFYQNADLGTVSEDQLVLLCDFTSKPTFTKVGANIQNIIYDGVILLGRKFESEVDAVPGVEDDPETEEDETVQEIEYQPATESSLDETYLQKYDRRLLDLIQLLALNISLFVCSNDLQIVSISIQNQINKFDENLDFVAATVTIQQ